MTSIALSHCSSRIQCSTTRRWDGDAVRGYHSFTSKCIGIFASVSVTHTASVQLQSQPCLSDDNYHRRRHGRREKASHQPHEMERVWSHRDQLFREGRSRQTRREHRSAESTGQCEAARAIARGFYMILSDQQGMTKFVCQLFEQRPIWTRTAIFNQFNPHEVRELLK